MIPAATPATTPMIAPTAPRTAASSNTSRRAWRRVRPAARRKPSLADPFENVHREGVHDPESGHDQRDRRERGQREQAIDGCADRPGEAGVQRGGLQRVRAGDRGEHRGRGRRLARDIADGEQVCAQHAQAPGGVRPADDDRLARGPRDRPGRDPDHAEGNDLAACEHLQRPAEREAEPVRDRRRQDHGSTGVEGWQRRCSLVAGRQHEPAVGEQVRAHDRDGIETLSRDGDGEPSDRAQVGHPGDSGQVGKLAGSSSATGLIEGEKLLRNDLREPRRGRLPSGRGDAPQRDEHGQGDRQPADGEYGSGSGHAPARCGSGAPRLAGTAAPAPPRARPAAPR